ncbi:MAG: 4'-phosphopantetheinyl transferase superfamily protein [Nostocaceae cyanobacterium]|nr:4'-phosphopantetheinyl transferase superfamily protein [Nostocaceae cyanobacterium]
MKALSPCLWQHVPLNLTLLPGMVHVFCATLDLSDELVHQLAQTLATDEQNRGNRFYFERDRKHFIACRGILRWLLSRYLEIEPNQVQFNYGRYGKPELAHTAGGQRLCFNLSHSHGLALYAIASQRSVGIDLEYIRPLRDAEQLAKRFFSPREFEAIASLPQEHKQARFFDIWTFKEAYLKATGEGLAGLGTVEVRLNSQTSETLLSINNDPQASERWTCTKLLPAPGYVGALVVEGDGWNQQCFRLDLDILPPG